ncbi:AarF/UbiB family protein [uncultured Methanobrevibacter sp.]|uniref:AarF/UbiB family protein n=1 Tax=uncultured Methanobrevibacter sp. TaxID=253161 RepID=UPI00261DDAAB|nr:AarF/UbiB family protein [uncultured Methanobrevibacter sp.]
MIFETITHVVGGLMESTSLIVLLIVLGYGLKITQDVINGGKSLPKIKFNELINFGLKGAVVYTFYLTIQVSVLGLISILLDFPIFELKEFILNISETISLLYEHDPVIFIIFILLGLITVYVTVFFMEIAEYCSSKLINMELIDGYEVTELYDNEIEGINNAEIAQYGCQSYLKQVLIDGFFHADPHPGNLFVTRDNRLCYIDFGMMGVVNDTFRSNFAQLVLLLLDGNSHHLINQLLYMNIITPEQNTDEFREDVDDLLNAYIGVDMDQMDGIFDDLMNVMINHNIVLPREFVMIGRGIILIEEAGDKLDPHFNLTGELETFAKDMIKSKFEPGNLVGGGFNYIVEIEHLLKDLPDRLNSTLDKVEKGEIELNMNHTGLDDLKNQLSISLIVAALLVGSSIAILADKGPKVWDISAIGFIGFVLSAVMGVYLIFKYLKD